MRKEVRLNAASRQICSHFLMQPSATDGQRFDGDVFAATFRAKHGKLDFKCHRTLLRKWRRQHRVDCGDDATARAIEDGLTFHAFSSDYIANILEARARKLPKPGPLQLTHREDLLDIELAEPDFPPCEIKDHKTDDSKK